MVEITDDNIDEILRDNDHVVIDFWASWCNPCLMIAPIIQQLADENKDIIIGKLDITANKLSAARYNVNSIPTLLYFKNGEILATTRGAMPKHVFQKNIDNLKN